MTTLGRAPTSRRPAATGVVVVLVVLLVVGGALLRLWELDEQPFDFHPTRQLYDALMARGFWADLGGEVAPAQAAAVDASQTPVIEPPVTQLGAALIYLVIGHPSVHAVRLLLAVVWMAGTVPVWRTAAHLHGRAGAVAASAVWLLAPYGVLASRSFQPDGLAVVLLAGLGWAVGRHRDEPGTRTWWTVATWGSAAVFVKLTTVFFVLPLVLVAVGLAGLRSRRAWVLLLVVVGPGIVYLVVGGLTGLTSGQSGGRIHPGLLLEGWFWRGWYLRSSEVVGPVGLVVVVLGAVLARGTARLLLVALSAGYVAFGLTFTYHYATHDYYHLPLLLVLALAVAACVQRLWDGVRSSQARLGHVAAAGAGLSLWAASLSVVPSFAQLGQGPGDEWRRSVASAREVGEAVGHSVGVVVLGPDYGHPVELYGAVAGPSWPVAGDLAKERIDGVSPVSVEERLRRLGQDAPLEWFVVTDLDELERQDDLDGYLRSHFPVTRRGEGWLAFDLRPGT